VASIPFNTVLRFIFIGVISLERLLVMGVRIDRSAVVNGSVGRNAGNTMQHEFLRLPWAPLPQGRGFIYQLIIQHYRGAPGLSIGRKGLLRWDDRQQDIRGLAGREMQRVLAAEDLGRPVPRIVV
jgi:hypothetical protein